MFWLNSNKKILISLCLVVLLSLPAIIPLFHTGFFQSDDGEWMIIRFSAFHQTFRSGQIPVRFLDRLNHGYGYPVANFLYPGFMYGAEIFKLMGAGFVTAIKLVFGLSLVASTLSTYLWLRKLFSNTASMLGAIIYLYLPYHLYDIYTRGSIGEVVALAIIPFILWQCERKSDVLSAIGIGLLLISHNTLALLFLPVLFVYGLIREGKSAFWMQIKVFFSGAALTTFFWLPAVAELSQTRFSAVKVSNIAHYFATLPMIGIGSVAIMACAIVFLVKIKRDKNISRVFVFFVAIAAVSIFYSISLSSYVWQYLPSSFIQFPFRLLSYLIPSLSFLSAYIFSEVKNKKLQWVMGGCLLALTFYSALAYIQPKEYFDKGEGFYATNEDTTTVKNEYMPKWVVKEPGEHPAQKVIGLQDGITISRLKTDANNLQFSVRASQPSTIRINTIYYPGWQVRVNGNTTPIDYANLEGLIEFKVPQGAANILVHFSETPLRTVADIISIASVVYLVVYQISKKNQT